MSLGSRNDRSRSGFTLIELMAVLVLVGLVSATAMLRFTGTTQRAQFEWSLERMMAADRMLREYSATCGQSGNLEFEIGSGHLERTLGAKHNSISAVELGTRVRIVQFLAARRHVERGKVTIAYDSYGHCETYAVEFEGPGAQSAWILFAGLTGQTRRFEDRRDVERILELIRPSRPDAG